MRLVRTGVDTYSYHRLLGRLRPREQPARTRLSDGGAAAARLALELGCDVVALQTCFLSLDGVDVPALRSAAKGKELILSWGHPEGLAFGTRPAEEADLMAWLEVAAALGCTLVRVVVGGPQLRGAEPTEAQIARTVAPLERCSTRAASRGIDLAVENHSDLTTAELADLLDRVDRPGLGVCLDLANVARLGEQVLHACGEIAPLVRMVHFKDIEPLAHVVDPIAGPCSVPYGQGTLPLAEILSALSTPIQAGAPVCLEIGQVRPGDDELDLLAGGMRWLRAFE